MITVREEYSYEMLLLRRFMECFKVEEGRWKFIDEDDPIWNGIIERHKIMDLLDETFEHLANEGLAEYEENDDGY